MSAHKLTQSANKSALLFVLLLACLGYGIPSRAQDVLTYHNNNARTGLNNKETILTTANVKKATFGKLFTLSVDGLVDAQPLYLSSITTSSGTHNLLVVATEHGSIYGFDADTGASLWHTSTLKPGESTSDSRGCDQVTPEIGITSTPVLVRLGSKAYIYAVSMSRDGSGNYHQRLHALDASSGSEAFHGPVDITARHPGTGDNSSGGFVTFDPSQYKERSALLFLNNTIYLAWASHCDIRPYTGWIMGYNPWTLAQTTVLNVTANGNSGAFWGSGAGLASDGSDIYALDANGVFDTTLNASGFPSDGDYGNAFLKLSTSNGLAVADYFEISDEQSENDNDIDLGSGGALVLPNILDTSKNVHQLAVGAGKDGNIYLVDRTNLGKFHSTSNTIYQELSGVLPGGMWGMPAYANGNLYFGSVNSPLLAFQFNNAKLQTAAVAQTSNSFAYPGTTPGISANAGGNAIVWAAENSNPAVLHAYDAGNLHELYNSNQAANNRDHFGVGNKFITPTIINGKVYVGTTNGVGVFGLLK